ncbi:hypothetical protein [Niallia sp. FSL W8-0954]
MKKDLILDYEEYMKDILFGEKDSQKVHAQNFLNVMVDLIIENSNQAELNNKSEERQVA